MAHFIGVFFQLEPPMSPMVRHPLPPHLFQPEFPPDFAQYQTHEDRA